ncbi:MAG: HAMP domain-containing protein [Chloroflexi bacterium]|nr:HAMP domain-containing protein [Chloroflexota bacterium]
MKPSSLQNLWLRFWDWAGGVSVRTKIFGIVLGSTLMLSMSFAIQVQTALFSLLEDESREQGVSIAREIAARATDLILTNDLFKLHELLQVTQDNYHDVRYAFILDDQGAVLAHTFGPGFPSGLMEVNSVEPGNIQNTEVIQTADGLVWDVAVPVFDGRAGTARVGISDQTVRQTQSSLTLTLILTILGVLAVSLLAATFLTWILTRPILGLVNATQLIAQGDFTPRVRRWANDEIGDLAEAFNHMADELGRMDELRLEREQLRRQLIEGVIIAQEDERRRISRELHDSTSQSLTSMMVGLKALEEKSTGQELHSQLDDLRKLLGQTLDNVHSLAVQLRPAVLDDLGLEAALDRFINEWHNRHNIPIDITVFLGAERLPGSVETAIYRIVQEALTNVARHSEAESVSVLVERRNGEAVAVIEDDGRGFDAEKASQEGKLGLLGMRERAILLGGRFTIESAIGKGSSIFVNIPIVVEETSLKEVGE